MELRHGCRVILVTLPITILSGLWNLLMQTKTLLPKDKITAFCQTSYIYFPSIIPNVTHTKTDEPWKIARLTSFQKPTISIRFNLIQACPSGTSFVSAALSKLPFNVLSNYLFFFHSIWLQLLVPWRACVSSLHRESASEERTAEELTVVFVNINLTNITAEHREKKYSFL